MATLQEQIDDLRGRVVALQNSLAARALISAMNTLNTQLSTDTATLVTKYNDLLNCVREVENALITARQDLIDA